MLAVALLLMLQVVLSGHHKDQHAGYDGDCPSCVFAHHIPSGLPDVDPVLVPVSAARSYRLERDDAYQAPAHSSRIVPKSQSPPQV